MSRLLAIEPEVFAALPGLRVVTVHATEIGPGHVEAVETRWRAAWARVHAAYGFPNAQSHPHVAAWRVAMKAAGAAPKEFPTSVEALVRRALRAPEPFHVQPLVDFYNAVSLELVVPAGGYDLDELRAPLDLRVTRPGDAFAALDGSPAEDVPPGEVAYACGASVVTRHLVWRQSRLGAISPRTRRALFVSEILPAHDDIAGRVDSALVGGLRDLFGATVRSVVLSAEAPAFTLEMAVAP